MIKRIIIITVLLIAGCTQPTAHLMNEKCLPGNEIEVFFCPQYNCSQILYNAFDQAKISIHCALYDLDLHEIIYLLEDKSEIVDVKLIMDTDNYDNVEHLSFAIGDNRSSIMHNKFCIVDSKKVLTGSMNPTQNGAFKNNNNVVILGSKKAAKLYEQEFQEMLNGEFGRGNRTESDNVLFCPEDECAQKIIEEINKAKTSIYFTAFSFTHDAIATELLLKYYSGLDIRGVFEKTRISRYSKYHILKHHGVDVILDKNKHVMHHKFWILDNKTVITGSFNPSYSADSRNDENIIILEDNQTARKFLEEFKYLAYVVT